MQMLQDGPYATAPEKPLRMTGSPESCRVSEDLAFIKYIDYCISCGSCWLSFCTTLLCESSVGLEVMANP